MSAEEEMGSDDEGEDDSNDPHTRLSHGLSKRRKQSLDEEEVHLADNLGSDLPDWDDSLVSRGFSADTPSPSPSPTLPPSPNPDESSRSDFSQSKFSHIY